MVWFRVDDSFAKSRKVLSIPKRRRAAAIGVWTLAGTWCAGELTDGFVPRYVLDEIPSGAQAVPDLVSANLWEVADGGWRFRNWADYQRSREDVEKERGEHAARQQAYRDRQKVKRDGGRDASRDAAVTAASVTTARPDPTRPDPTVVPTELPTEAKRPSASPRATRLPPEWEPSLDLMSWVRSECPNVDGRTETANFRDYWISKAGKDATKVDWPATYRRWMRTAQERRPPERAGQAGISTGTQRAMAAVSAAQQIRDARSQQLQIGAS